MKTKTILVSTILAALATFSVVSAQGLSVSVSAKANVGAATASTTASTTVKENKGNSTTTKNNNASTTANTDGQLNADSHRSAVSLFVKSLLDIANREGGIGSQVRLIAQKQNVSATTTTSAMAKVDGRSTLRTLLLGTDYKNLGVIRSEIATTSGNIAQLKTLLSGVVNESDRVALDAQIKVLENQQIKIEAYVKAHENVFGVFGWFSKLFSK